MKFYLSKKFLLGFVVSVVILGFLGIASFLFIENVIRLSRQGAKSQHVLFLSEKIRSLINEKEKSGLENRVNRDPAAPDPSLEVSTSLKSSVTDLTASTRDDTVQSRNVKELFKKIEDVIASDPPSLITYRNIRSDIDAIQSYEASIRRQRQELVTSQFYQFIFTFVGLLLLGFAVPIILAFALNRNLKDRTLAEEKLQQAAETIHDLYENAPCGYFSLNNEGVFIHANRTLLGFLGFTKDELVDRMHFEEIVRLEDKSLFKDAFENLRKDGSLSNIEFEVVRKNNTRLFASINAVSILDERDNLVSSRCTLFDITVIKKAAAEIEKANHELEAFSYSVSHDLRAPLRSINGFAKILSEDHQLTVNQDAQRLLGKIITNANRMGQLIDDLLSFSKLGRKEIVKEEIDLDLFVKGIANELTDQEKGRAVCVDIKPLGTCLADQSMLQQVWVNLIANALKYTRKKESALIEIGSEMSNDEKVFYVRDNGVGFDMQFSNKLFGVFQRLHKMEDFEGTGVGLALVKRIIEKHHGGIWANANVNNGATFFFTIPENGI